MAIGDDESLSLSADTLAALQSFMAEKQAIDDKFEQLKGKAEQDFDTKQLEITMDMFQEDWQLSQFWYDDTTANFLADTALRNTEASDYVAFISAPTAYVALRRKDIAARPNAHLFEFDQRFSVFNDQFVLYDYNKPTDFVEADALKGKFKFIYTDPPFLNKDCLGKMIRTMKFLAAPGCKIMIVTGAVMEKQAEVEIGARATGFAPTHRGGLSNEFLCYTTFEDELLKWV
ncbi:Protein-lysine N-methyltransferase efm5 [Linderina macrospora]|uniref:Protein-lysine N-methyltransferase efm5 n=1 Tax=Linderina macrospora TaxID=4868 RepID=A0ACC1JH55_9FUNG|nr:Protein-lysine N-methyltransferase efm5 [Linderina macrospora]